MIMDRPSEFLSRLLGSTFLRGIPLAALAISLIGTALIKLVTGYRPHYMLHEVAYYAISLAEIAAAALLFTRHRRLVAASIGLLSGVLIVVVGRMPIEGPCGCVGVFEWSRSTHRGVLCALGMTAALVGLVGNPPRPSNQT
jgi:hypothetical protein